MIAGALIALLRPARTPDEAMQRAILLMRVARWLFLINLFALTATLTLIGLIKWSGI